MIRYALTLTLALAAGIAGLLLVYTDIGPGDVGPGRVVVGAIYFALCGVVIGVIGPAGKGRWIAAIAAWAMIVLGAVGVRVSLTEPASADMPFALMLLLGPLVCVLAGGRLGARLAGQATAAPGE